MGANTHPTPTVENNVENSEKEWAVYIVKDGTEHYTGMYVDATTESIAKNRATEIVKRLNDIINPDNTDKELCAVMVKQLIV